MLVRQSLREGSACIISQLGGIVGQTQILVLLFSRRVEFGLRDAVRKVLQAALLVCELDHGIEGAGDPFVVLFSYSAGLYSRRACGALPK